MANSPIWMREEGLGNLEPLSPYAHDEIRNTFKLGYLGQRGGSNGLGKLPALAESFGGGITVLTDSTDRAVQEAIAQFRGQMANTYPDETRLHTLVCVPTFAPRTCLRHKRSGVIKLRGKVLSLLVSKRFVDYVSDCTYHISSTLSLDEFEVSPLVDTILTLSRPNQLGSEFPSRVARYTTTAPDRDCPWHMLNDDRSYSPFWYGRDPYGDGTPNGMVYVPSSMYDNEFYVICTRQPLANDSGFYDGNGQGVLFVHRTHADVPDEEWMLSHINRYRIGMNPEELLQEMLYGTKLHGSYTDDEGHFRALCWHDFSHRYSLPMLYFQNYWHSDEYYKSSWITHYDQYGGKSIYGYIKGKSQANFERWAAIQQRLYYNTPPEMSLHVKVEGNKWDRMDYYAQSQARHAIRVSDLSGAGGTYQIFDPDSGTILASGSASPNGSCELSFCPGQFEEFRKSKRKTFGFSATNSFIIGNPEELAEMKRTPFPAAEEGTFNYQEITDQIYL